MGYNKTMKKIILCMMIITALLLGACSSRKEREEDQRLATEVAMISTSIRETVSADWTETPTPTDPPTATPTETAPVSIFVVPTDTPSPEDTPAPEIPPTATEAIQIPEFTEPTNTPVPVETRKVGHFVTRTPGPGYPTPDGRPLAKDWREWPVLPVVSDTAYDIYWYGVQELGTNPHYISRIGDCHSESDVFLGIYDTDYYELSDENLYMTDAIDFFRGSFSQISYSVHAGMSVSSVLTSTWSDPSVCQLYESALDCEIRVNNPSIMFVNLGSNWIAGVGMDVYYDYLSEIVQKLLDHGILPILSSKADNVEGDYGINETTVQVARDFDIPFYNFWVVAQRLPYKGLDPARDGIHLSMEAWNWRNFYALKTLYTVGKKLELF